METFNSKNLYCDVSEAALLKQRLAKYGVVVCRNFASQEDLQGLQKDYQQLRSEEHPGTFVETEKNICHRRRSNTFEDNAKYEHIRAVPGHHIFRTLGDDFFGHDDYGWGRLYATYDQGPVMMNHLWHQDPTGILKCLIYLDDVGDFDGPFCYEPGSHKHGYYVLRHVRTGPSPTQGIYYASDEIVNPVAFPAKAGDAIFFNTNGRHQAGELRAGNTRRTLNYHIEAFDQHDDNFSVKHRAWSLPESPVD